MTDGESGDVDDAHVSGDVDDVHGSRDVHESGGQESTSEETTSEEWSDGAGGPIAGVGGSGGPWTPSVLTDVRERPRRRAGALVVAVLVGVAAAWVHWLGLVVAGALVGLASRTVPRALLAAVAVGLLVLVVQVLASPVMDAGEFLALTPPAYVAVAAAVALPAWGSLIRGVI